jgi:hypothetical protein
MMDKTLDMLKKLSDYTDGATTEDKDTEIFEESISVITNELWELGILLNKMRTEEMIKQS